MARLPTKRSTSSEITSFLKKTRDITAFNEQQPRLLFAIDATASRQPTWNTACQLQQEMFRATDAVASLAVQLCYFRGFGEFRASPWLSDTQTLASLMDEVRCEGGHTQIARLLRHALTEHSKVPLQALIFIGDAMEENPDTLCQLAGECGLRKLPLFLFQEGSLNEVAGTFTSMAKLSNGAYARFDHASAARLGELLGAVASFAAGGRKALENNASDSAKLLLQQLKT